MSESPYTEPETCGACIAFLKRTVGEDGPTGECRFRPEMGTISHALPWCQKYVERGSGNRWKGKRAVQGRAPNRDDDETREREAESRNKPRVRRNPDRAQQSQSTLREAPKRILPKRIDLGENMDTEALRSLLQQILREEGVLDDAPLGRKWEGGSVVLKPGDDSLQPKEIPIDTFFHKIVMVRERLRVLEQKINGHSGLTDQEKVEFQQYVTRAYGSLTTFNVLFRDASDQFRGAKG